MAACRYLPHEIPAKWRDLLLLIPGYDSIVTAGPGDLFDADAAQLAIDFFPNCLTFIEGKGAGGPFILQRWQQAIIANLFGWKRRTAAGEIVRRYIEVFLFCARKNGKSPFVAGIALLVFFTDPEPGQQNTIAAADKKQAAKLFRHCRGMIDREPELASRCQIYGGSSRSAVQAIVREEDESFLEIISAEATGKHGDNPHAIFLDELHEQPNPDLVEALESGFVSAVRLQPLFICLTTADYDRPSICNRKYRRAKAICAGSIEIRDGKPVGDVVHDPQFLPVVYEVPAAADWRDESQWHLANPNLGVSVSLEQLRRKCKKAQEEPLEENAFRRLHLNQQTTTAEKVIPLDQWDACAVVAPARIDEAALAGRDCCAALDIGAISDLTALARLFPHDDTERVEMPGEEGQPPRFVIRRSYTLLMTFWLPESPRARDPGMRKVIESWIKQGYIRTTPGNMTDYDLVVDDIVKLLKPYQLKGLLFDRGFQGSQTGTNLMKHYDTKVEWFSQAILSMNAPFRELLQMLPAKRLHHDGNPCMRWMVGNTMAERRGGLIKPSKDKSPEKIDGVTALVMAVALGSRDDGNSNWFAARGGLRG